MDRRTMIGALATTLAASRARAQAGWPSGPLRIVIPTPPGGGIDLLARVVAQRLTASLGQPVLVDPRPGATGIIAANGVAKAPADGQTLLFSHSAVLTNPMLQASAPYRMEELAPLAIAAILPIAYGIDAALPAANLREFVGLARARPRFYTYASYGTGSAGHLIGETLGKAAGIQLLHVPYKGEAPAVADLLGGQVHSAYASPGGLTRVPPNRVRIVAVASARRMTAFPDIPVFSESGLPEADLPGWGGFFVPVGTPAPVQDRLAQELVRVMALEEVRTKTLEVGFEPASMGPDAFRQFLGAQASRLAAVVREQNIRIE